jgi:thiol-disulfide isomerase/thioredoxin
MLGAFLIYVWILPSSTGTAYGTKVPLSLEQIAEAAHSSGLYKGSAFVDELNKNTYEVIQRAKSPTAILYYASWCGHCR